jgi:23S rRNA (adenine1618-N6)-methyltransferase
LGHLNLHHKNRHKQGYNFKALIKAEPKLSKLIIKNKFNGQDTIDFSDALALKTLNSALLKCHYQISFWDIPDGYLCPPIPGRVDYLHYLKDLLTHTPEQFLSKDSTVRVLDIGTGASCIYPILGQRQYNWQFVASDIDPVSIKVAKQIISANKGLRENIHCRLQVNESHIFKGVINDAEFYHLSLCNPPFHKSLADASEGTSRKWQNLNKTKKNTQTKVTKLNFGGQKAELWCNGGELAFISRMIKESKEYHHQVVWFTCLVSKKQHLSKLKLLLKKASAKQIKVINMSQGQKISRFIAWSFFDMQ